MWFGDSILRPSSMWFNKSGHQEEKKRKGVEQMPRRRRSPVNSGRLGYFGRISGLPPCGFHMPPTFSDLLTILFPFAFPPYHLHLIRYIATATMIISKVCPKVRMGTTSPSASLSQLTRYFSSSRPLRKEIQDAYILSAARTPTGKVHTCPYSP